MISNPGNYSTYPRNPGTRLPLLQKTMRKLDISNNHFIVETGAVQLQNALDNNYHLASTSPVIDMGADISRYSINTDFDFKPHIRGLTYDIGAVEQYCHGPISLPHACAGFPSILKT